MKKLVVSTLLVLPLITASSAYSSKNISSSFETIAHNEFQDWFADYDMYCKHLREIRLAHSAKKTVAMTEIEASIDENIDLSQRLKNMTGLSAEEIFAKRKLMDQLSYEQASLSLQSNLSQSKKVKADAVRMSLLGLKAESSRTEALRVLSALGNTTASL